jgi:hypothetical protein
MAPLTLPQNPAPSPGAPTAVTIGGGSALPLNVSRPMSREDVQLLQNRRSELSRQLTSASSRRSDVVREMGRSPNGREGLESHLKVLDERIVQLEKDIAVNGQLLASAPPNLVAETTPSFIPDSPVRTINGTAVSMTAIIAIAVVAMSASRRLFSRRVPAAPALPPETADRIARIENAVESIAVEVERISEGQRFVTKLMNDPRQLGAGGMKPIELQQGAPVRLERPESG